MQDLVDEKKKSKDLQKSLEIIAGKTCVLFGYLHGLITTVHKTFNDCLYHLAVRKEFNFEDILKTKFGDSLSLQLGCDLEAGLKARLGSVESEARDIPAKLNFSSQQSAFNHLLSDLKNNLNWNDISLEEIFTNSVLSNKAKEVLSPRKLSQASSLSSKKISCYDSQSNLNSQTQKNNLVKNESASSQRNLNKKSSLQPDEAHVELPGSFPLANPDSRPSKFNDRAEKEKKSSNAQQKTQADFLKSIKIAIPESKKGQTDASDFTCTNCQTVLKRGTKEEKIKDLTQSAKKKIEIELEQAAVSEEIANLKEKLREMAGQIERSQGRLSQAVAERHSLIKSLESDTRQLENLAGLIGSEQESNFALSAAVHKVSKLFQMIDRAEAKGDSGISKIYKIQQKESLKKLHSEIELMVGNAAQLNCDFIILQSESEILENVKEELSNRVDNMNHKRNQMATSADNLGLEVS